MLLRRATGRLRSLTDTGKNTFEPWETYAPSDRGGGLSPFRVGFFSARACLPSIVPRPALCSSGVPVPFCPSPFASPRGPHLFYRLSAVLRNTTVSGRERSGKTIPGEIVRRTRMVTAHSSLQRPSPHPRLPEQPPRVRDAGENPHRRVTPEHRRDKDRRVGRPVRPREPRERGP